MRRRRRNARIPAQRTPARKAEHRWGRKRVLLIGLFGFVIGTVLFNSVPYSGLSDVLTGWTSFAALVAACMMHAAMMSANAYMADITEASNRTKGMGAAGAANNYGSILRPAVSGIAMFSLLLPLRVMAFVRLLNGIFVCRVSPEPPRQGAPLRGPRMKYTDPRILPFVIVGVLMFSGMAFVQQTIGFRFQDTLGFAISPLVGDALYQMNPALPYAFAAGIYLVLFASMHWIGKRVTEHSDAA